MDQPHSDDSGHGVFDTQTSEGPGGATARSDLASRSPPTQNPTPTSIKHRGDNVVLSRTMFGSIGLFYCSMLFAAIVTKSLKAQEMATLPQTFEQNGVIKQIEHEDLLISIENWL